MAPTRTWTLRAVAACAVIVMTATPAFAARPPASSWWTSSAVPLSPDPDAALVVQGSAEPDAPLAYAAVAFTVPDGEEPAQLTLTVPGDAVTTPGAALTVCRLAEPFQPARGAPMEEAPSYDCATRATATPVDGVYTVDVQGLASAGELAVALLPTTPADRIVLAPPAEDALTTRAAAPPGDVPAGDAPPPSPLPPPEGRPTTPNPPSARALPLPTAPRTSRAPTVPPAAAAAQAVATGAPAAGSTVAPRAASSARSATGDASPTGVLVAIGLAAAAATLWLGSGRSDDGSA